MANLTINPSDVVPGQAQSSGEAKEAIEAGEAIRIDTDGIYLAENDQEQIDGIATSTAERSGQRIYYQSNGDVVIGSGFTPGDTIYLSTPAGKVTATFADVVAGKYISILGVIKTATTLQLALAATGETK